MSDPTQLIVGIPVFNDSDFQLLKGRYCNCHGYNISHKNCQFCDKHGYDRNHKDCIQHHNAGYELHTKGFPTGIVGLTIFKTWNDAIEISDLVLKDIELAKNKIKKQFSDEFEPKIFVIGGQT